MSKIKIGVLGCANIAERMMIPAIKACNSFELVAVSSRNKDKAKSFANKFCCDNIVGYDELLKCDIDAVYIPLPTGLHYEWIIKALSAGKHILTEKSIATNFAEVEEIINKAEQKRLHVHENFMFQYHSQLDFVREQLKNIGQIKLFRSSFGFPKFAEESNIRYKKSLGGGVLLDAGAYTVKASQLFLGLKQDVEYSYLNNEGNEVDFQGTVILRNQNNIISQLSFGFDNFYQNNIEIWGDTGKITITRAFTAGPGFTPTVIIDMQGIRKEYQLSADNHFIKSLEMFKESVKSSSFLEHEVILNQAQLLDKIRLRGRHENTI